MPNNHLYSTNHNQPDEGFLSYLVSQQLLTATDRDMINTATRDNPEPLLVIINRLGFLSEDGIAVSAAEFLDVPLADKDIFLDAALLTDDLATRFVLANKVLPVSAGDTVTIAMSNPFDQFTVDAVAFATEKPVQVVVMTSSELEDLQERLYGENRKEVDRLVSEFDSGNELNAFDAEQLKDMASEAPVVRLVNLIIQRAMDASASDIHIEPFENNLIIRHRIDGILREAESLPTESSTAVISRIKLMARLNIAETRLPQDGRIRLRLQGQDIDLRISTVPTLHGESVVIRLLRRENKPITLESLGFSPHTLKQYAKALQSPHGIILVTGPTGSGKTTTLYATLNQMNDRKRKIISVEDPVEYELTGVNQIQVKPQIGLDFSSALRSIVRQDPDIIMIGEMRDLETAEIATHAALTGHLVLSTLHTNDAASAIIRLMDMGIASYLISSTVTAIVAQRLVRMLCSHCKEAYSPTIELLKDLEVDLATGDFTFYKSVGCAYCSNQGYHGRTTIAEILVMDDSIKKMLLQHADPVKIQLKAVEYGLISLQNDGVQKALQGITSLDEVFRVTNTS